MKTLALIVCTFAASTVAATEILQTSFYSGNDNYGFCKRDREAAFQYVAGLYDEATHAAWGLARVTRGLHPLASTLEEVDTL